MSELIPIPTLSGEISSRGGIDGSLSVPDVISPDTYEGDYMITPSEDDQIIEIADMMAAENITIKAVPANYGRLEYNGSYLRVY